MLNKCHKKVFLIFLHTLNRLANAIVSIKNAQDLVKFVWKPQNA